MSLASFFVLKKIYNDVKLLIKELNKHAESESYAVVIIRFKKFKKNINRIVKSSEIKNSEVKSNEINVLLYLLSFKRI